MKSLSNIHFEPFSEHIETKEDKKINRKKFYNPNKVGGDFYHPNRRRMSRPSIMDTRYDSSPWTWFYRSHPQRYRHEHHHYNNSRLFGYPHWYDHFTNPTNSNIYIVVIVILLLLCYLLR